jgi:hypothetical protein
MGAKRELLCDGRRHVCVGVRLRPDRPAYLIGEEFILDLTEMYSNFYFESASTFTSDVLKACHCYPVCRTLQCNGGRPFHFDRLA